MGYDVSGFSQLASIHCKEPLVLALIEHDIMYMGGKKPSPLLMVTISYLGALQFAYYNNKLRQAPPPAAPAQSGAVPHDPSDQSRPLTQSRAVPAAQQGAAPQVKEKDLNTLYNELPDI